MPCKATGRTTHKQTLTNPAFHSHMKNTNPSRETSYEKSELAFVWFTFRRDGAHLLRSVQSVRRLYPDATLIIADDLNDPLRPRAIRTLESMGCLMAPTSWPRNGNLRGWHVAYGIAQTLSWAAVVTGADAVVKIDSDVVLLRRGWIDEFMSSGCVAGGFQSKCKRGICGPCYALKPEAIADLLKSYETEISSPYSTEEDYEMTSRLMRTHGKDPEGWMMRVPYSFLGLSPEWHDARCGMMMWTQDKPAWRGMIARQWEALCAGYDPPPPADAVAEERMTSRGPVTVSTTKTGWSLWQRARVARCRVMRDMMKLSTNK